MLFLVRLPSCAISACVGVYDFATLPPTTGPAMSPAMMASVLSCSPLVNRRCSAISSFVGGPSCAAIRRLSLSSSGLLRRLLKRPSPPMTIAGSSAVATSSPHFCRFTNPKAFSASNSGRDTRLRNSSIRLWTATGPYFLATSIRSRNSDSVTGLGAVIGMHCSFCVTPHHALIFLGRCCSRATRLHEHADSGGVARIGSPVRICGVQIARQ